MSCPAWMSLSFLQFRRNGFGALIQPSVAFKFATQCYPSDYKTFILFQNGRYVKAKKYICAGEAVVIEEPVAAHLSRSYADTNCTHCLRKVIRNLVIFFTQRMIINYVITFSREILLRNKTYLIKPFLIGLFPGVAIVMIGKLKLNWDAQNDELFTCCNELIWDLKFRLNHQD